VSSVRIANGHDNEASLEELQDIFSGTDPLLFAEYTAYDAVETEWHDAEAVEIDGDGNPKLIGLPWCVWKFGRLTAAEVVMLKTLGPNVTINTYNKSAGGYTDFNAVMDYIEVGELDWDMGGYDDVNITFRRLEEIF